MHKQLKKISLSFISSCLLVNLGYGETPCQNGHNYNNECDPYYNINLIEAKIPSSRRKDNDNNIISSANSVVAHSSNKLITTQYNTTNQKDLTYLDSLRQKYSKQFNGRMGLQALIDRSGYLTLKKIDEEEKKEIKEQEETKNKKEEVKKVIVKKIAKSSKEEKSRKIITKKEKKKETKLVSKKDLNITIKKHKLVAKVKKSKVSNFYVVKSGDSLIKIAKKLGINKKLILRANKLDKNATIKIGQKLKLPALSKNKIKIARISKKIEKNKKIVKKSNINKNIYIVKSGDSLSKIAKALNISITKLREYNQLSRSSKIKVGQKLSLKPTNSVYKTKSYDFVKNIKLRKVPSLKFKRKIHVVATAYTSHSNQTDKTPFLAAWNNRIRPGMKIIAVSPDLIRKYGLTNGVKVKILGLPGYYVVRDKMNKRLRNHIDIYMGVNKRRALRWGRKRIVLYW